MKFRKKPVIIDAWEVKEVSLADTKLLHVMHGLPLWHVGRINGKTGIIIPTLEGDHLAEKGDWILKGVAGEYYPCKPDIFKATYEPVDDLIDERRERCER